MSSLSPKIIHSIITQNKFNIKKNLGQNFLWDENILSKIVDFSGVSKGTTVLEIGPGLGALTDHLLKRAKKVVAVEIDKSLCEILSKKYENYDNFTLIHGDFLKLTENMGDKTDVLQIFLNGSHTMRPLQNTISASKSINDPQNSINATKSINDPQNTINVTKSINDPQNTINASKSINEPQNNVNNGEKLTCVANLPYYITSPIIMRLLSLNFIDNLTVMVQKEVGDRIFAKPSTKDYGILTLAIQYYSTPVDKFFVSRNCFYPAPNVDSMVIRLNKNNNYNNNYYHNAAHDFSFDTLLFDVIRKSFSQRRKKLINSLSSSGEITKTAIKASLEKMGFDENVRAENLTLYDYITLSSSIAQI